MIEERIRDFLLIVLLVLFIVGFLYAYAVNGFSAAPENVHTKRIYKSDGSTLGGMASYVTLEPVEEWTDE